MVFFQNYYWFKKSDPIFSSIENTSDLFPILTDHYFKECLLAIRPKLKLYKSYEQSKEEVAKLQQELYPNLFSETNESESGLGTIAEEGNTDTNNDNTEDTSEAGDALGSDDEVRQRRTDDEENSPENDEYGTDAAIDAMDDVSSSFKIHQKNKFLNIFFLFISFSFRHQTNQIPQLNHVKSNVHRRILSLKRCATKCTLIAIRSGCVKRSKQAKIFQFQ